MDAEDFADIYYEIANAVGAENAIKIHSLFRGQQRWRRRDLKCPPPSHSRCASLDMLAPSTPCFGRFRFAKNDTQSFLSCYPRLFASQNDARKSNLHFVKNKGYPDWDIPCFWRRRRDLNSRAGIPGLHP